MLRFILIFSFIASFLVSCQPSQKGKSDSAWENLFNENDLSGWYNYNQKEPKSFTGISKSCQ